MSIQTLSLPFKAETIKDDDGIWRGKILVIADPFPDRDKLIQIEVVSKKTPPGGQGSEAQYTALKVGRADFALRANDNSYTLKVADQASDFVDWFKGVGWHSASWKKNAGSHLILRCVRLTSGSSGGDIENEEDHAQAIFSGNIHISAPFGTFYAGAPHFNKGAKTNNSNDKAAAKRNGKDHKRLSRV